MQPPPPICTLFPYTTLFRSIAAQRVLGNLFAGLLLAVTQPLKSGEDRKSTRLNSSHVKNSYAVSCLKKKKTTPYLPIPHSACLEQAPVGPVPTLALHLHRRS